MKEYTLKSEYIELIKLLKLLGYADTGGMAKLMVDEGRVLLNGKIESRKRAKLRSGDEITIGLEKVTIR